MFVFHSHKDKSLYLETFGFYEIHPEASLQEFFRLNFQITFWYFVIIMVKINKLTLKNFSE